MQASASELVGEPNRSPIRELGHMTWTEVAALVDPILVIPIGSLEQHGPHLPLATDTIIADALARQLCAARSATVLAPALTFTASGEHQDFVGTLSIGTDATAATLIELVRSADWCAGVVLINAHGGNAAALMTATQKLAAEGRDVLLWWPTIAGGDLHAGQTETSLMLAIAPDRVRLDQAVDGPSPSVADLRMHGVAALSRSGVLGAATQANAQHGVRLLEQVRDGLVVAFDRWRLK